MVDVRVGEVVDGEQARLQRRLGLVVALVAFGLALVNFLWSPNRATLTLAERLLEPQVSAVALVGLIAVLSSYLTALRWLQVAMLVLVAIGSAVDATPGDQTPFVWFLLSMLLAWEYGCFSRAGRVLTAGAVLSFVALRVILVALGSRQTVPAVAASLGAIVIIGSFAWALIVLRQRDSVRRQRELEDLVTARTRDLEDALEDQSLLLAELHHRTRNNLQIVSSMLWFETGSDGASERAIAASDARIQSLARVHELLYATSNTGDTDLSRFLAEYLAMARDIARSQGILIAYGIRVSKRMPTDFAIRLGIILNEIVMNATELAAPNRSAEPCDFSIDIIEQGAMLAVTAREACSGFVAAPSERALLGHTLIESMTSRLGGAAVLDGDDHANWKIEIPLDRRESRWD
ncbi:MAG: sensor histidine kinase [Spirochaetota bacterium]